MKQQLTKVAILALKGTDWSVKQEIAKATGVSDKTVYRWITENNDSLTKSASLQIIKRITGLEEADLLEDISESTAA